MLLALRFNEAVELVLKIDRCFVAPKIVVLAILLLHRGKFRAVRHEVFQSTFDWEQAVKFESICEEDVPNTFASCRISSKPPRDRS